MTLEQAERARTFLKYKEDFINEYSKFMNSEEYYWLISNLETENKDIFNLIVKLKDAKLQKYYDIIEKIQ